MTGEDRVSRVRGDAKEGSGGGGGGGTGRDRKEERATTNESTRDRWQSFLPETKIDNVYRISARVSSFCDRGTCKQRTSKVSSRREWVIWCLLPKKGRMEGTISARRFLSLRRPSSQLISTMSHGRWREERERRSLKLLRSARSLTLRKTNEVSASLWAFNGEIQEKAVD